MFSWWFQDEFLMMSWWYQDDFRMSLILIIAGNEELSRDFSQLDFQLQFLFSLNFSRLQGNCHHNHHYWDHYCRYCHHNHHHPIQLPPPHLPWYTWSISILTSILLLIDHIHIIYFNGSHSHNQPSFRTMITPGTRHTPLGNGIWDSAMKDIFPQGFLLVPHLILWRGFDKREKPKIMKKMSSGGDLTPFSGCYNSQLITGRKISFA